MAGKPLGLRMSRKTTPHRRLGTSVLLLSVFLGAALLPFVLSQPAKAAQFSLTLYVSALGWSFTSGGEARPGPVLLAVQGDQVDVTMTSEDFLWHGLFIDYNGNGVPDSGDFVSPQTMGTIQFSIPADTLGTYTYGDQVVTLNTGTWVTRVNSPPEASFHAPTATTSWTGGVSHDISFDVTDPDGDPSQVSVSYPYGGGASHAIQSFSARQLTFRPGGSLAVGTQYEVHVNATSSDASDPGNALGHDSMWTFSTGTLTDRTPPRILSLSANPIAQVEDGFVNVTADIEDTGEIATVTAAIQGPGRNQNVSMTHAAGARWS